MPQVTATSDLEADIATLIKQAGESLRRQSDEGAPATAAPPLQPTPDPAPRQESEQ